MYFIKSLFIDFYDNPSKYFNFQTLVCQLFLLLNTKQVIFQTALKANETEPPFRRNNYRNLKRCSEKLIIRMYFLEKN